MSLGDKPVDLRNRLPVTNNENLGKGPASAQRRGGDKKGSELTYQKRGKAGVLAEAKKLSDLEQIKGIQQKDLGSHLVSGDVENNTTQFRLVMETNLQKETGPLGLVLSLSEGEQQYNGPGENRVEMGLPDGQKFNDQDLPLVEGDILEVTPLQSSDNYQLENTIDRGVGYGSVLKEVRRVTLRSVKRVARLGP